MRELAALIFALDLTALALVESPARSPPGALISRASAAPFRVSVHRVAL